MTFVGIGLSFHWAWGWHESDHPYEYDVVFMAGPLMLLFVEDQP